MWDKESIYDLPDKLDKFVICEISVAVNKKHCFSLNNYYFEFFMWFIDKIQSFLRNSSLLPIKISAIPIFDKWFVDIVNHMFATK